jgi:hypothetical protein
MSQEPQQETRTVLPLIAEGEDTFIPLWEFSISLRQVLTVLSGAAVFFVLFQLSTALLPLPGLLAAVIWSWVIIGALALAFVPKNGAPLEEHLTAKMQFLLSERHYVLMDAEDEVFDLDETDWEEVASREWR